MEMDQETRWMAGICAALAVVTAALAYVSLTQKRTGPKGAGNAPQLQLDNPGTQADFPTSATESEVG